VVSCCEFGNEHSGFIKGGEFLANISFLRSTLLHVASEFCC
jgi:hypothetical protein